MLVPEITHRLEDVGIVALVDDDHLEPVAGQRLHDQGVEARAH